MRFLPLLFALSTPVSAGLITSTNDAPPVITGPIPVSGSGFFESNPLGVFGGWEIRFSLSGTDGADNVSLFVDGGNPDFSSLVSVPDPITNMHLMGFFEGLAAIDSVMAMFPSGVTFPIGNGSGSIDITDSTGALLAQADLLGYIQITSEVDTYGALPGGTYGLFEVTQGFNIVPTPEPSSGISVGAVLIGIGLAIGRGFSERQGLR